MSLAPFFLTGAMAKVQVNGVTMAFCTDISYSIRVAHASPKVLGMFESSTLEPMSYDVTGSFRVIRFTKNLSEYLMRGDLGAVQYSSMILGEGRHANYSGNRQVGLPDGVDAYGNGIGSFDKNKTAKPNARKAANSFLGSSMGNGRADQSLDPSKLYWPQFFDIEIKQLAQNGVGNSTDEGMVARLRQCRITGSDFTMSKRGVATQVFMFQACYADEDTFLTSESGVGQPQS